MRGIEYFYKDWDYDEMQDLPLYKVKRYKRLLKSVKGRAIKDALK